MSFRQPLCVCVHQIRYSKSTLCAGGCAMANIIVLGAFCGIWFTQNRSVPFIRHRAKWIYMFTIASILHSLSPPNCYAVTVPSGRYTAFKSRANHRSTPLMKRAHLISTIRSTDIIIFTTKLLSLIIPS